MSQAISRRLFLGSSAATLGYFFTASATSAVRAADSPSGKLRIAGIGVGGKGSSDIDQAGNLGEVVALCDIDENHLGAKTSKWTDAKKFFDYRKLYDECGKLIDAVVVSTPDHTHAHASLLGIRMKKHVYCQKPLTHSVYEARQMRLEAKKFGVCTQMGNQGTAENGLRRAVELIQSGLIGKVTEVHVWTNRPVWPQAPGIVARPEPAKEIPKHVHWDEFIGPAPERPYAAAYHPFKWRGFWDFGTGALGDMACHTANMAFMALKLGSPTTIAATSGELNPETYPAWANVVMQFPARGEMPAVTWNWYEGKRDGKKVLPPEELLKKVLNEVEVKDKDGKVTKRIENLADSGSILVGDKGILFSPNDYGAAFRIIGVDTKGVNLSKPEKLPVNGKGDQGMKNEWVEAIKSGKPEVALSNFDYAGMLTEAVLLGNVAIRTQKKLEFDAANLTCRNCPEAAQFIKRPSRKGWDIDAV